MKNEEVKHSNRINLREIVNKWKPALRAILFAFMTFGSPDMQRLHAQHKPQEIIEQAQNARMQDKNERVAWALKETLEQFHTKVANHNKNKPHNLEDAWKHLFSKEDHEFSGLFGQIFSEAFLKDSVAQYMPLDARDLELQKKYVDYYFAPASKESRNKKGYFFQPNNRIWTNTDSEPNMFAQIIIHEIGHFFGLGESLALLFAEKLMGTEVPGINSWDWEYNVTFDKLLLEKVGEEKFWGAAFLSENDYKNLWDQTMPVKYDHLLRARSLNRIAVNAGAQGGNEPQYVGLQQKYSAMMLNKAGENKKLNSTPRELFGAALEEFAKAVKENDGGAADKFQEFLYQQFEIARELRILDFASRQGLKSPHIVSVFDDVEYHQIKRTALKNKQTGMKAGNTAGKSK